MFGQYILALEILEAATITDLGIHRCFIISVEWQNLRTNQSQCSKAPFNRELATVLETCKLLLLSWGFKHPNI